MKPAKAILAFLAIFGAVATASAAPVVLHITGSTAFRAQTLTAAFKSFDASTNVSVGSDKTAYTSSNYAYLHGTMNGADTIIEMTFTGSTGGIKATTSQAAIDFFPDNLDTAGNTTSVAVVTGSSALPTITLTANAAPSTNKVAADVTMADTTQSTTVFRSPVLTPASPEIVGVVAFQWIRTPSADSQVAALTNMNPRTANLLFGNGSLPLAFWSGLASDETNIVYAAGRDPDSGTRLSAFAETGLGANATVVQYHPTGASTAVSGGGSGGSGQDSTATAGVSNNGHITSVEIYPDTTVVNLGQLFTNGNAGEASGGNLSGYMAKIFSTGTPGAMVTYASTNDTKTAIANGAIPLTWNGVAISNSPGLATPTFNFDLVRNGQYSFWTYERMLCKNGIDTTHKTIANKIATQIQTYDAPVLLSSMRVSRQIDGGIIGPNY